MSCLDLDLSSSELFATSHRGHDARAGRDDHGSALCFGDGITVDLDIDALDVALQRDRERPSLRLELLLQHLCARAHRFGRRFVGEHRCGEPGRLGVALEIEEGGREIVADGRGIAEPERLAECALGARGLVLFHTRDALREERAGALRGGLLGVVRGPSFPRCSFVIRRGIRNLRERNRRYNERQDHVARERRSPEHDGHGDSTIRTREGYVSFEERYQLHAPLGKSERGTVWNAQDKKLGRKVVVAVVGAGASEARSTRFVEQMEKLVALRHASVVRVFDVGRTADGSPYASMDFVEGETLEARMTSGPPMRVDQAVRMVADLLGAVAAMHAAGVVHGDIEPGNVLVKERGGRVSPTLIGFGLDRSAQRSGAEPIDTERVRALAYMSPAQARGESQADEASDVYSTAALLFSLLTGRLPHRGEDADRLREHVRGGAVRSIRDVREELGGPIAEVLDAALSSDASKRYASAEAFSKALRAALIRTRNPGSLATIVGARTVEPDPSEDTQAPKRASTEGAVAPAKPSKPAAAAGRGPRKATIVGMPKAALPPKQADVPKREAATSTMTDALDGATTEKRESIERDEAVSAGADTSAEPAGESPSLTWPSEPTRERKDESLEFERLSGLLEISDPSPPRRVAPPPPPRSADEAARDEDEPVETGDEEAREGAPADASTAVDYGAPSEAELDEQPQPMVVPDDEPPRAVVDARPPPEPVVAKPPREEARPVEARAPSKNALEIEAEEIPGVRTGMPTWVWAVAGVAAAALVVVGVVLGSSGDGETAETLPIEQNAPSDIDVDEPAEPAEDAPAVGAEASPTAEAPAAQPDPAAETAEAVDPTGEGAEAAEAEAPAAATITLTLTGVPEGASVTVDGNAVEGTEVELPSADAQHTVEVRLEGHRPFSQTVAGDSSTELAVTLEPEQTRSARHSRHGRRSRAARNERRTRRQHQSAREQRPSQSSSSRRQRSGRPSAVSDPGF